MKNIVSAVVVAALFSVILCGCIIVVKDGSDVGTTQYVHGELHSTLDYPFIKSTAAVKFATQKLKFTTVSERTDALYAQVIVKTAQDKKIKVKLNKITDTTTKIAIGVGAFGDKSLSYKLLEEIQAHCEAVPL